MICSISSLGRMLISTIALFAIHFTSPIAMAQQTTSSATKLKTLLDQVWEDEIEQSPMLATNIGDPRFQDRLADVSYPSDVAVS